jgi:putative transcriptional regulator
MRRAERGYPAAMESLQGQLLIAAPSLLDPNFRRTVILIAQHTEDGAMGIVLNRPSEATVLDAVPLLGDLVGDDAAIWAGGPVEPGGVIVLAAFDDATEAAELIFGDVGFMSADADPADVARATRRARVFAGYAGWTAGQLEGELGEESWLTAAPIEDDVFAPEGDLWSDVLARQGGAYALLSKMPPDPSLN